MTKLQKKAAEHRYEARLKEEALLLAGEGGVAPAPTSTRATRSSASSGELADQMSSMMAGASARAVADEDIDEDL